MVLKRTSSGDKSEISHKNAILCYVVTIYISFIKEHSYLDMTKIEHYFCK